MFFRIPIKMIFIDLQLYFNEFETYFTLHVYHMWSEIIQAQVNLTESHQKTHFALLAQKVTSVNHGWAL